MLKVEGTILWLLSAWNLSSLPGNDLAFIKNLISHLSSKKNLCCSKNSLEWKRFFISGNAKHLKSIKCRVLVFQDHFMTFPPHVNEKHKKDWINIYWEQCKRFPAHALWRWLICYDAFASKAAEIWQSVSLLLFLRCGCWSSPALCLCQLDTSCQYLSMVSDKTELK